MPRTTRKEREDRRRHALEIVSGGYGWGDATKIIENTYKVSLRTAIRNVDLAFEPYQLRHAFGYRTGNMNIPTGVASKWMDHSDATHTSTYKKAYDESDAIKTLKFLNQQQQQQQ